MNKQEKIKLCEGVCAAEEDDFYLFEDYVFPIDPKTDYPLSELIPVGQGGAILYKDDL